MTYPTQAHATGLAGIALIALVVSSLAGPALAQTAAAGTGAAGGPGIAVGTSQTVAAPAAVSASQDDATPPDPTLPKPKKKKLAVAPASGDQPPVALDGANAPVAADTGPQASPPAADQKSKKKKQVAATAAASDSDTPADPTDPTTTSATAAKPPKKAAAADSAGPLGAAGCRTRGFTVNDYGKDGPTADAKRLLDQDITDWAKANGLKNIKVGTKKVDCFQFLNFIAFDEWTCTATAQICWKNTP